MELKDHAVAAESARYRGAIQIAGSVAHEPTGWISAVPSSSKTVEHILGLSLSSRCKGKDDSQRDCRRKHAVGFLGVHRASGLHGIAPELFSWDSALLRVSLSAW